MPYRPIDRGIKRRAVTLLEDNWDIAELSAIFDVSERSIWRWKSSSILHGDVEPPHSYPQGRPPLATSAITGDILDLIKRVPDAYLREIREWVAAYHNKIISEPALHRLLTDIGITHKKLTRNAAERDEEARNEFRRILAEEVDAGMCVCIDESAKDERTIYRHYGRAPSGQRATVEAPFVRGTRYSIVPAMTVDGYICTKVVPGSLDMVTFTLFVLEEVIPQMNTYPGPRSVLIMDNCQIHKSTLIREALDARGCRLLFLPAYSPDLHPIEHSFSAFKAYIRANYEYFQNHADPVHALQVACLNSIDAEKCTAWFRHCGYRLPADADNE